MHSGVAAAHDVAETFTPDQRVANYEWSPTVLLLQVMHFPGSLCAWPSRRTGRFNLGYPPTIEGLPAIGGVGTNSVWDAGDTATMTFTFTFSEAVDVNTTGGTPTVGFDLGGTTELLFGYEVVAADGSMTGNDVALNGGTIRNSATQVDADLAHEGVLVQGSSATAKSDEAPRVTFENRPRSRDGSSAFVDPADAGDVTLEIPARACTKTGAVRVNGQPLAEAVEATVPGASGQGATGGSDHGELVERSQGA